MMMRVATMPPMTPSQLRADMRSISGANDRVTTTTRNCTKTELT